MVIRGKTETRPSPARPFRQTPFSNSGRGNASAWADAPGRRHFYQNARALDSICAPDLPVRQK